MEFFRRLFGKKKEPAKTASVDTARDNEPISVFDGYGRELRLTRRQWRDEVLPGNLKSAWDKPDELYNVIVGSLSDGFRSAVVEAAEHLYKIDSGSSRAACVWGVVLAEEGRLTEAKTVFLDFITRHGEDGFILTNLAKVHSQLKDDAKAEEVLWHALEVDPNQDNGVLWYQAIHRERGGEGSGISALQRIASLPGSWRAQIWLARSSLEQSQLSQAMTQYREALAHAGTPVPADLLFQMSGDLGRHGHLSELLEVTSPYFDADVHGLQVGNNLIKAHHDLGQLDAARCLVDALYARNRPDWKETLSFWDTEIAKARVAASHVDSSKPLAVTMLTLENPVWLPQASPALAAFPSKPPNAPIVCFMGSSAATPNPSKTVQPQMADAPGRLSRALPLFLAEQTYFGSLAKVFTLVPFLTGDGPGFVLSGGPTGDENAVSHAKQAAPDCGLMVTIHILAQTDPWTAELRLIRVVDQACVANLKATFQPAAFEDEFFQLAARLLKSLSEHGLETNPFPPLYRVPTGSEFSMYLLRLEQLLAVRSASMDGCTGFLSGEREILDGNIGLCLACPDSATTRFLLAQTVLAMKKTRPAVIPEFHHKLALLQKEKPLVEPAHAIVARMLDERELK